jgi:hypothetical protein
MSYTKSVLLALVLCCSAAPASAQPVQLRFHDGLVTLSTQNAPLRAILAEWARLGGTTVVNGERVAGPPLTLELNAVPERQALDVLLRGVAGYMLAPRAGLAPGASVFDRVIILPTSSGPRNAPPPPGLGGRPGVPQPQLPQMPVQPDPEDLEEDPPQDVPPDEPPVVNPTGRPLPQPRDIVQPNGRPQPFETQPEPEDDPSAQPAPQSGNPFGLPTGTTARPGVVTPVPDQQQPRRNQPDTEP